MLFQRAGQVKTPNDILALARSHWNMLYHRHDCTAISALLLTALEQSHEAKLKVVNEDLREAL